MSAPFIEPCKCADCGRVFETSQCRELEDCESLGTRLDPGSVVPFGECPVCGAFVYLQGAEQSARAAAPDLLEALQEIARIPYSLNDSERCLIGRVARAAIAKAGA